MTTVSSKTYFHLTPKQLSSLVLRVYRHTAASPAPSESLETFVDLINASFTGPYHDENFGRDKPRYTSVQVLEKDLEGADEGGWMLMLILPAGSGKGEVAVAGAKVTLSGKDMDGGPSIHFVTNPSYAPSSSPLPSHTYFLGALGTISPRTGPLLLTRIKRFLSHLSPSGYILKAYTVAEWGINPQFDIPQDSPLVNFFAKQGFAVTEYGWKPKGTWGSFHGACLASIEYVHSGATAG